MVLGKNTPYHYTSVSSRQRRISMLKHVLLRQKCFKNNNFYIIR